MTLLYAHALSAISHTKLWKAADTQCSLSEAGFDARSESIAVTGKLSLESRSERLRPCVLRGLSISGQRLWCICTKFSTGSFYKKKKISGKTEFRQNYLRNDHA
jgi:hypothetical protein